MVVSFLYSPSSFENISAVQSHARPDMVIHFDSSYCFSLTAEETYRDEFQPQVVFREANQFTLHL